MNLRNAFRTLGVLSASLLVCSVRADVKLPALFSDNMVLQQGQPVAVWGWADDGEKIEVTFRGTTVKTKAKKGKWSVKLAALKAGGPDELVVQGKNKLTVENVLVGEVWICSGQSNMEFPLTRAFEGSNAIAASANPSIRLFHVPRLKANEPTNDVVADWQAASPETTSNFSAVAYYFGRDLQKALNVPIGLIETSWGGSPAEVWMSERVLESKYKHDIVDSYAEKAGTQPVSKNGRAMWKPAELYNGMIAPLIPYGVKGAIWYQGESNAGRAKQYRTLFPDMIKNWRHDWGSDFTFLAVQLAPYDKVKKRPLADITGTPENSDWAELREAQMFATKALPRVGIAVITDVGEKDDIHPKKKEPVGARLALAARGIAYGESIEYSGPVFKSMRTHGPEAILSFDHADGLEARDGDLKGFAICGRDGTFTWAKAVIEGNNIVVSNPGVFDAVAVRYGWSDFPVVNLWNKAGLPASPFRTDDFRMVTDKSK